MRSAIKSEVAAYFVTALVPSLMACFASSPGKTNLAAVCISRDEIVLFPFFDAKMDASPANLSNKSDTNEHKTLMAL